MFPDIGGSELIIVAIVALLVVKPKDLPVMMRKIGEFTAQARRMANDFRASFEDMARQSELDELRKEVEAMRSKAADPMGLTTAIQETGQEIQASFTEPTADPNFDYDHGAPDRMADAVTAEPAPATPKARKRAMTKAKAPVAVAKASKPAKAASAPRKRAAPKTAKKAT
jgi:sec-independent protein translocase protein TatB